MRLIDADKLVADQIEHMRIIYSDMVKELTEHIGVDDYEPLNVFGLQKYANAKCNVDYLMSVIEHAHTIDPAKHGHLEILDFGESGVFGFCSLCGEAMKLQYMTTMPYYCQWCGAKMDEEVEG